MLDRVREAHDRLDRRTATVAREITNLAATMKVLESVDERAVDDALEETVDTIEALEEFLAALEEAADDVAAGELSREQFRDTVEELEPPPGPDPGCRTPEPSQPRHEEGSNDEPEEPFAEISPLRRLSAPYSVLLNLERDLYAERVRRPFALRKLKEIWGDLNRAGSSHPSDGLVAHLGRLAASLDPDRDAAPSDVPWSESDRRAVADLAERTRAIRNWDAETLRRREREAWVERVENWVVTAEEEPGSVAHMEEMLTRFLTDLPREQTPDVRMLLERILELEDLAPELRDKTERALDDH